MRKLLITLILMMSFTGDYVMGAMTSKEKYDYIVYHMGADWCLPCRVMLRNVWPGKDERGRPTNEDMRKFLEKNRIRLVLLDHELDKDARYFSAYEAWRINEEGLISYPSIIMVNNRDVSEVVMAKHGGRSKKQMMVEITDAIRTHKNSK